MQDMRRLKTPDSVRTLSDGFRLDLEFLLDEIRTLSLKYQSSLHPRGKVLFAEGEPAEGLFILRAGRVIESISSSEGRVVTLRIGEVGDVLGLNSALQNSAYDSTVKTLEPCRTDFISQVDLIRLIERSRPATHALLRILSRELTEIANRFRSLLLPQTASAKLARLLLEWCDHDERHKALVVQIDRRFTHEEIAQMICSSRETVTRLLAILRRRRIIQITSNGILIYDRSALETIALY